MFGKPEPTVQELVTACVVRKEGSEVKYYNVTNPKHSFEDWALRCKIYIFPSLIRLFNHLFWPGDSQWSANAGGWKGESVYGLAWEENKWALWLISGGRSQEAERRGPFRGEDPEEPARKDPQEKSRQSFRLTSERECDLQTKMNITFICFSYLC